MSTTIPPKRPAQRALREHKQAIPASADQNRPHNPLISHYAKFGQAVGPPQILRLQQKEMLVWKDRSLIYKHLRRRPPQDPANSQPEQPARPLEEWRYDSGLDPNDLSDDWSYFYIPNAMFDDEDIAAFAAFYRERAPSGMSFDEDIKLQEKKTIPVEERSASHDTPGGNVLYLGGNVEFIPYPGKWPMTERAIALLNELDALGAN